MSLEALQEPPDVLQEPTVRMVLSNDDLITVIFSFLDVVTLTRVARTSRDWNRVSGRAEQWRNVVLLTRPMTSAQVD